jgi:hypothetical protein
LYYNNINKLSNNKNKTLRGVLRVSKLKQMIKNEIEKDKGLAAKIANKMGHANPSTLNKFLNNPEREMESFCSLLAMVQELFPDREFEVMGEYIKTLNPKKKPARVALEYTQVNKLNEAHEYLLEEMIDCANADSRDLAKVYKIEYDVAAGKIKPIDAIVIYNNLCVNSIEAKTFVAVCKYYCYYDLSLINVMSIFKDLTESSISQIEDEYLRKSYLIRYNSITSEINLHKNNVCHVRKRLQNIESCENEYHKALKYLTLGNSYIFESFEKASEYMMKSLEIATKYNYENRIIQAQRSLNFVQNYWRKIPMYLNEESDKISDRHELAFFYIRNNNSKGLEILNSINIDDLTDLQKGFYFFYKGLALDSKEMYFKSLKSFNICGEEFYKNLPIIELKKSGVEDYILDAFLG